uniref:Uncharacterized protein n=1 Tax=Pristionchus pacificus TaxID=54126 RepID=A0A2A6CPY0_PRIPA|eukprot:PDM80156.1 hypothetical protein PRIPAC_32735 [Pristionchus pacificus]
MSGQFSVGDTEPLGEALRCLMFESDYSGTAGSPRKVSSGCNRCGFEEKIEERERSSRLLKTRRKDIAAQGFQKSEEG